MCGCEIEGERRDIEKLNTREIHGGEGRNTLCNVIISELSKQIITNEFDSH